MNFRELTGGDKLPAKEPDELNLPKSFSKKDVFYRYSVVFLMALLLIIGTTVVLWYTHDKTKSINKRAAITDAEHYAAAITQFRNFYSKVVIPNAEERGVVITHDNANLQGSLPVHSGLATSELERSVTSDGDSFTVRLYSEKPFSWNDGHTMDSFEKKALELLKKDPETPVWAFDTLNGQPVLRYARGDVMQESCVGCHNSYPGTPKTDWKVGELRGVLEILRPMSQFEFAHQDALKQSFVMMLVLILSMLSLIFFTLKKLSSTIKIAYNSYLLSEDTNKLLTTEIEHREQISHELKASEVKMRAIVNSVQEVIVVININGIITECNRAVKDIFGYTQEEVIGQNVSMLMTSTHKHKHDHYMKQYVQMGKHTVIGITREFQAQRKDGQIFPVEVFVNDARVDNQVMFTGTIRDITHRKKTEEIAAAAHKAAIESANMKSEFLANMSHEIRTPMNGVIGMTEMLLDSKLDEEQQDLALTVKESASALLVIINDILDFSKIEAGKLSIKKTHFSLLHMVEACIDLLVNEAARKNVELAFFIDKSVPEKINGDPGRIRQIIINLLNNALKFTDHGHVILSVTMVGRDQLRFAVIDSGVGIPKDAQATLFDMFSQVDSSSSREHGGTGLGLAICKQLVGLMDGRIGVHSEPDVGSTFWFTIKVDPVKSAAEPFIKASIKVLMMSTTHLLNRYHYKQMEQWNMQPTIVTNMNQVMRELHTSTYDMLALDADSLFFDPEHPAGVQSVLATLGQKTKAPIVLFASKAVFSQIETLNIQGNVHLMPKPIKHTVIKLLLKKLDNSDKTEEQNSTLPQKNKKSALGELNEGFHVLLAEDNRVNQKVAMAILGKMGCSVTVASNGQEALEYAENDMFEAVFMDCQMPVMDGYESSKRIRMLPESHHSHGIPIIAFTAHAMKDDDTKCKASGMDDYLSKPIDIVELKEIFARWDDKMKQRKQLRLNKEANDQQTEPA